MNKKQIQAFSIKALEEPATYTVKDKIFFVESMFQDQGTETLSDVLIRLMKSDMAES